jgi:hypothetical protein
MEAEGKYPSAFSFGDKQMYICSFKCLETKFDIFNSEKVLLIENRQKYFITPERAIKIEKWLIENNKDKIKTQEEIDFTISQGWLGSYD